MNQIVFKLVDRFYQYIFGYPMGERAQKFIKNLALTIPGVGGSAILSFIFTIFAGRLLGVKEYGVANLVFAVANFITLFSASGISVAATKYIAEHEENQKRKIISTSIVLFLIAILFFLPILYIFRNLFAQLIKTSADIFSWAIVYAIILSFANLAESILKGLQRFVQVAIMNILSMLGFIGVLATFLFVFENTNASSLILANILKLVVPTLLIFIVIKNFLGSPDRYWAKKLIFYSVINVLGMIPAMLFVNINPLMLNYFLDINKVGLYSAYFLASSGLMVRGFQIFFTVFFPTVSSIPEKKSIFLKLNKLLIYTAPLLIGIFFSLTYLVLTLFGNEYHKDFVLAISFSINAFLYLVVYIFFWLINSIDLVSSRFVAMTFWISIGIHFVLNIVLIPCLGLHGSLLSSSFSLFFLIASYHFFFFRLYRERLNLR